MRPEDKPERKGEFSPAALALLGTCILGVVLGPTGLLLNSFSLFIDPITQDFGWPRARIMLLLTVMSVALAASSPLKGWLIDRFSLRGLMVCATLGIGLTFAAIAAIGGWWSGALGFFALGLLAPGNLPYARMIALWFDRRRGIAFGLFGLGFGLGGAASLMLGGFLVERMGWRGALAAYGAMEMLLAAPLFWLFLRCPARPVPESGEPAMPEGLTLRQALASRCYWLVLANLVLTVFAISGFVAHGVPMLMERGLALEQATRAFALLWIGMSIAQIALGHALDRYRVPLVALPFAICAIIGLVLLQSRQGFPALAAGVLLLGFGGGGESGTTQYFITRYFGLRHLGAIYGSIQPFVFAVSVGLGAFVPGVLHDTGGGYGPALAVLTACLAIAALLLPLLGPFAFVAGGEDR